MLRSFLIILSSAGWAQRLVTSWKFAWRAASRFVTGNTIQEALKVVQELNSKGINATLDHLGESTTMPRVTCAPPPGQFPPSPPRCDPGPP